MYKRQIQYRSIGTVHSPYKKLENIPKQPSTVEGNAAIVELYPEYIKGLQGIEKYSHIVLVCHLHLSERYSLKLQPYGGEKPLRGVFATRAPARPNAIGISVVRLTKVNGNRLYLADIDLVDGTPLLDIKPYMKCTYSAC